MAASHRRVQDLQIKHRLGRVEACGVQCTVRAFGLRSILQRGGPVFEGFETLFGQRLQGAVDDQVHQFLWGIKTAAVLAGVGIGADGDHCRLRPRTGSRSSSRS